VQIATTILSLEILASSFAGWSAIYPKASSRAHAILKRNTHSPHMPLMEFYLYPPKHVSSAVIATLAPPVTRQAGETDRYRASGSEFTGDIVPSDGLETGAGPVGREPTLPRCRLTRLRPP